MTIRVQIPVYTDRWMMGDRYGEVVKTTRQRSFPMIDGTRRDTAQPAVVKDIAHVKLDKSGKTIKVLLDDCEWLP